MIPEDINKKLIIPEEDSASPVKSSEAAFIYDFIKKNKITATCEVGFAYAKSAAHIIAAVHEDNKNEHLKHIVMDPFQDNYQDLAMKNLKALGLDKYVDYRNDFSHNVLPLLHKENKKFDFIFIDGDHKFDGEFVDFYYSDLLLNQDGYVLLHDTWMRTTRLVMAFINKNRPDYKYIKTPLRNIALYQKTGKDNRNGMYYKEFFTMKSFMTHHVIMWLTTGKGSPLKKLVLKLKNLLK